MACKAYSMAYWPIAWPMGPQHGQVAYSMAYGYSIAHKACSMAYGAYSMAYGLAAWPTGLQHGLQAYSMAYGS